MAKTLANRFEEFKKRNSLTDKRITDMLTEYSQLVDEHARTYFCERYNVTPYVFYKARDFAIILCLIDSKTIDAVEKKMNNNQASHNEKSNNASSRDHFAKLRRMRNTYLDSFSKEKVREIAELFLSGERFTDIASKFDIAVYAAKGIIVHRFCEAFAQNDNARILAERFEMNLSSVKKLLAKCVKEHVVSEKVYLQMKHVSDKISGRNDYHGTTIEDLWLGRQ